MKNFLKILPLAGGMAMVASVAMAAECVHSKYGADDEIGAANMLSPERTLAAAQLIKKERAIRWAS